MSDAETKAPSAERESTGLVERMVERFADRVESVETVAEARDGACVVRKIVRLHRAA